MRERITLGVVVLVAAVLVVSTGIRAYVIDGALRQEAVEQQSREALLLAELLERRLAAGTPMTASEIATHLADTEQVEVRFEGQDPVVAAGVDYDPSEADLATTVERSAVQVRLRDAPTSAPESWGGWGPLLLLGLVLLLVSGAAAFLLARLLSEPFRRLADAARALGRGRFELDLPRSRIPEAAAITTALESSAEQLRGRLERDRELALHASHSLRTPLTSMRIELEGLAVDPDLSDDARDTVHRCVERITQLDAASGHLVAITRGGALVEGSEVPLGVLATQMAQRTADLLGGSGRALSAAVDGDTDAVYTPGPVEQVVERLLADVVVHCTGPVRLTVEGAGDVVRISLGSSACDRTHDEVHQTLIGQIGGLAEALGGHLREREGLHEVEVLLPRR